MTAAGTAPLSSHAQPEEDALPAAAGPNLQPAQQQHCTQLLAVSPSSVPAVIHPDAAAIKHILTAATAPDLSPGSCPHLYYSWPTAPQGHPPDAGQPRRTESSSTSTTTWQLISSVGQQVQGQELQQGQQQQDLQGADSLAALQHAAELLRAGKPVAIPTETVYGLAANALSASAVAAVFAAKGRPSDNPLIVHVSDLDMLAQLYPQQQHHQHDPSQQLDDSSNDQPVCTNNQTNSNGNGSTSSSNLSFLPSQYHRLIAAFWPGPLTLLLPASPLIPAAVTAGLSTVAVRMPAHPVARALIAAAGVPLAAPSANTSGRPSPTTAHHVMQDLAGRVAAVVDGGSCECGVESTVLDGLRCPPVVLRPGGVTPELLGLCTDMEGLQVYQRDFTDAQLEAQPTTPGMKYRHYSPNAPLLLVDPTPAWHARKQQQQQLKHGQPADNQQQLHSSLQQLVVQATQVLLNDLWRQQQHQQREDVQLQQQQQGSSAGPRVVLLRTCGSSSGGKTASSAIGWTPDSMEALQHQQKCSDQQPVCHHQQQLQGSVLDQNKPNGVSQQLTPSHSAAQYSFGGGSSNGTTGSGSSNGGSSSSSDFEVLEYVLGSWQQPEVVAQQVFAALRAADAVGPAFIIAQGLPPEGAALAVMNRLHKAASQHVHVTA